MTVCGVIAFLMRHRERVFVLSTERCSRCSAELDAAEQAFVFGGGIVCGGCDEILRNDELVLKVEDRPVHRADFAEARVIDTGQGEVDLAQAKKKRKLYLLFFVLSNVAYVLMMIFVGRASDGTVGPAVPLLALLQLLCIVLFYVFFLSTVKLVKGYSTGVMILIGVALFVPIISIFVLLRLDSDMFKRIHAYENPDALADDGKRRLCRWALYSFLLLVVPGVGLLLGVIALVAISKSGGRLYGKTLAWISVVISSMILLFFVFMVVASSMGK